MPFAIPTNFIGIEIVRLIKEKRSPCQSSKEMPCELAEVVSR